MTKRRVVFIGIDGAAVSLIQPWMLSGILPNFALAAKEGIIANLTSVIPPMTATGWVSLSTGKNPGKHGIFDFYRIVNYEKQVISSRDVAVPHIWQLASQAGKKVIVVNPPVSFPPDEVNGFFIGGMLTPSYDSEYTYPSSLKKDLVRLGYSIGVELEPGKRSNYARSFVMNKSLKDRQRLIGIFNHIAERRVETVETLAKRIDWDFIYLMFEGTDRLQHYYWDADDFYVIREHYRKIDELLGRLRRLGDSETVFMVGSDHGFDGIRYKFYINNFLAACGLLTPAPEAGRRHNLLRWGRRAFEALAKAGIPIQNILTSSFAFRFYRGCYRPFIDWERTKAFMFNETSRGIWIHLKNRHPKGIVEKSEYYPLREFIINKLNEIRDPKSGERIITAYPREVVYKGLYTHNAPDILVVTQKNYSVEPIIRSDKEYLGARGFIDEPSIGERNADHTMDGLFMMFGAGIMPSQPSGTVHITDIAPTVLYLLGLDIPVDMDGVNLI